MTPEATPAVEVAAPASGRVIWLLGLVPLVLLGMLLAVLVGVGPETLFPARNAPPVERLAITELQLTPGEIQLTVLNDGPDEVTIAQVVVDDAFWQFEVTPGATLRHLQRARVRIPYPWVEAETHRVKLLTSTGLTFEREIGVALETPRPTARFLGVFALIGLYVGVIPVAIGLLWYPLMSRLGQRGLEFLLALTVGLLIFLLVDSADDGLEAAAALPDSFQGAALFVFGAAGAYFVLEMVGAWLKRRRAGAEGHGGHEGHEGVGAATGWILALLVAIGIGLHNFGEGLAIGSAFALGELALGTLLIVGFTLHNTTEGLAIVAPLARERSRTAPVPLGQLVQLGLIGGVPTILGAWMGGFVQSPALAVLFLALGVGGIAQVTRQIVRQTARGQELGAYLRQGHVLAGLAFGVLVMYATGLVVG